MTIKEGFLSIPDVQSIEITRVLGAGYDWKVKLLNGNMRKREATDIFDALAQIAAYIRENVN